MPCVGMGTFGSDRVSAEEVSEAVAGAIRCGYRLFDCAACYGNEPQIGQIFQEAFQEGVVERKDLFIMSKVWNDMHRDVETACRKSIRDLKCDYLDMYFIHWPFPNYHAPGCDVDSRNPDSRPFTVEEFMDTYRQCEELVEKGLIKHIGISNMTIPKMDAVLSMMKIKPERQRLRCTRRSSSGNSSNIWRLTVSFLWDICPSAHREGLREILWKRTSQILRCRRFRRLPGIMAYTLPS